MSDIKILINDFKQYLGKQDLSKNTIRNYIADIENFASWYDQYHGEEIEVKNITAYHLNFFREQILNGKRLKVSSVNRKTQTLKRFFRFLTGKKIIKSNVADSIKFIRRTKTTKPNSLNKNEVHALLSMAGNSAHGLSSRNYAVIQLLLQTGLRISELINLQWRDLILYERSGSVRVVDSKGHKERVIPLNNSARKALSLYIKRNEYDPTTPVFLSKHGKIHTARALQKIISNLAKKANINRIRVTPHVLRHTFATNYLKANPGCLIELATLLGHESIDTTAIYTKASVEHLHETLEKAQFVNNQ
ncbi:tyrosine-type recombinase/integrase [Candidatus Tisiphia endosymbiont of Sialis lutaria]|uniref:tyrosine-type recombinase/integrase n=1 Tax=Candidatus Tisiphia endosymbiont of Sialis lutaria TaxID=2029164 RepID=UPI00312CAF48